MQLPGWGWLLVLLWLAAGSAAFAIGFLSQLESPKALWYFLAGEERFRPLRFSLNLLPIIAILAVWLLLGPLGLLPAFMGRRARRQKVQRIEQSHLRRRAARQRKHPTQHDDPDHAGS